MTTTTRTSRSLPSCAVLHNNIGALLHRKGEYNDAKKHYQLAMDNNHNDKSGAAAAGGLAWFHRKLLAEQQKHGCHVDVAVHDENDVDSMTRQENGSAATAAAVGLVRKNSHNGGLVRKNSGLIRRNSAGSIASSCSSCHETTPLGLEYYREPITVTADENVTAASRLNLALLRYVQNANHNNTVLEEIYKHLVKQQEASKTRSPFLAAAHDCNTGVVLFRLDKAKQALSHFASANNVLLKTQTHDGDLLEWAYLKTTVLLNYARACVRLNDIKTAVCLVEEIQELADETAKKRKKQQRNSSSHHHCTNNHSMDSSTILLGRIRWMALVATRYLMGMVHQRREELVKAFECYKTFVTLARHELGHGHLHVATVLYMKGMVLFDQRKLHFAMLAQLACLKIHEQCHFQNVQAMSQVMYSIGRTLHDREEYRDALRMYQQTLSLQRQIMASEHDNVSVHVVTTLCNIARVHHVVGDLDACLTVNQEIVDMAKKLARGKKHPFVADRLVVLGNVLVEAGRLQEAMDAFSHAARSTSDNNNNDHVRNRYDIDARWASTLAKAGLQHPSAATA